MQRTVERSYDPNGAYVVLLGTGTPNADPERSGPSLAIVANDVAYLVDAGTGIVRRAATVAQMGVDVSTAYWAHIGLSLAGLLAFIFLGSAPSAHNLNDAKRVR